MAVKDESVAAAGAGIREVRQFVVRAVEMLGVAPIGAALDVADVEHAATDIANVQASPAAIAACSCARRRRIRRLNRI